MNLDIRTIVFMAAAICLPIALLMLLSWWRNREERTLLWWSGAFLFSALGLALVVPRGFVSDILTIDIANTFVVLGVAMGWAGARAFDGRPVPVVAVLAGAAAWLIACRLPAFHDSLSYRISGVSLLYIVYTTAAAVEYGRGRGDGLTARYMLAAFCGAIAVVYVPRFLSGLLAPERAGDYLQPSIWTAISVMAPLVFAITNAVLVIVATMERAVAAQRQIAAIDPLTGALNRGATLARTGEMLSNGARKPGAMLLFDLDFFKRINDRFGHPTGDRVLKAFAAVAGRELRGGDVFGRIGGEEFLAFLPGADKIAAMAVAERIRSAFANAGLEKGGHPIPTTVSIGIAVADRGESDVDPLLIAADHALYTAKKNGRDRVQFAIAKAA